MLTYGKEVLLAITCLVAVQGLPVPMSQQYNHSAQLDSEGKYILYWAYNKTHITFEVHVETKGYVGFGISPNGNMYPSDVVIGWVKDGQTYFSDRHTTAHAPPIVDKSQDWFLLHGEENEYGTILKFVRKLDTCDPEDRAIDDQTVRVIYSYHPDDPASETNLLYHGVERRGAKSLSLLGASIAPPTFKDDDIKILEFRHRNYIVPAKDTTYACIGFQLPDLGGKHHMIEFEPIITPGNEHHVHHINVQRCNGTYPHLDMAVAECTGPYPKDWPQCPEIFSVWGTGGGPFYFPDDAGYSVGGPYDFNFYVLQVHYDNPTIKTDILDSSGIRVRITSKLRQHDVGGLNLGQVVTNYQVIPPEEQSFISRGYCSAQCINKAMNRTNIQEVKIIGQIQHAHLLATRITTRHFRKGVELDPIADDPYYDVKVQEVRPVNPPRTILPGDSFIVECTYNSTGKTVPTFGGFSTHEEMCTTFLYIYPDIAVMTCDSLPVFDTYPERGPAQHQKFLDMNWSDKSVKDDFYQRLDNSSVFHHCINRIDSKFQTDSAMFKETYQPFVPKDAKKNCPATGQA